jgi:thiol-disulfide isomerase/thioredoxin
MRSRGVVFFVLVVVLLAFVLPAVTLAASADGTELKPGDPAPALDVGKWVQGEPVKSFEKGKVYVVECWATWCGPCRATIPHLNELSKKHTDVTFMGVDVWEEEESKVEPFVKEMGDKMTYRVALDNKSKHEKGAIAETWMKAAGQNGIPAAFIIDKDTKIAWVGHPMTMDKPLADILAGTFDLKKEAAKATAEKKLQADLQAKVVGPLRKGDTAGAIAAVDELIKANPDNKAKLQNVKLSLLVRKGDLDGALAVMDDLTSAPDAEAEMLTGLATAVLKSPQFAAKRDADRALKWATKAVEMTKGKDADAQAAVALAHAQKGEFDKAAEAQQKAVDAADAGEKADQTKALEAYKAKKLPDDK